MSTKKLLTFGLPLLAVVLLDRFTKYWVRTTPAVQDWDIIPGWLSFHFILNPGMALGIDWFPTSMLSIISILVTIGFIAYVFYYMPQAKPGFLFCMGLVVGGAIGNIIDRLFLGSIQGVGGVFDGQVVDFIHFTATIQGYPVFPYIFNVADAAITTALIALLIFHKQLLPDEDEDKKLDKKEVVEERYKDIRE